MCDSFVSCVAWATSENFFFFTFFSGWTTRASDRGRETIFHANSFDELSSTRSSAIALTFRPVSEGALRGTKCPTKVSLNGTLQAYRMSSHDPGALSCSCVSLQSPHCSADFAVRTSSSSFYEELCSNDSSNKLQPKAQSIVISFGFLLLLTRVVVLLAATRLIFFSLPTSITMF